MGFCPVTLKLSSTHRPCFVSPEASWPRSHLPSSLWGREPGSHRRPLHTPWTLSYSSSPAVVSISLVTVEEVPSLLIPLLWPHLSISITVASAQVSLLWVLPRPPPSISIHAILLPCTSDPPSALNPASAPTDLACTQAYLQAFAHTSVPTSPTSNALPFCLPNPFWFFKTVLQTLSPGSLPGAHTLG